jgi:putative ABC transport system ATP-binding protein
VTDPAIILADEPTGNLDTRTGEEIMAIVEGLNVQGRTIIIVTHEAAVANRCTRQVHIRDGRIINEIGGPKICSSGPSSK